MVLILLPLLLYLPVLHHDFLRLWDDDACVLDNPHVRTGLTLANVRWAFTSFEQSNWHPVTWLSHMLDCQLFGLNAEAQHGVNLVLHLANVWLLFWLLQKATGQLWRSFFVALFFAVHPLNVETVAWIARRKSLLSALFALLSVWMVRPARRMEPISRAAVPLCSGSDGETDGAKPARSFAAVRLLADAAIRRTWAFASLETACAGKGSPTRHECGEFCAHGEGAESGRIGDEPVSSAGFNAYRERCNFLRCIHRKDFLACAPGDLLSAAAFTVHG
jgi:hypothetical protein